MYKKLLLSKNKLSINNLSKTLTKVTLINQFFPPDYAATGQLLEQLTKLLIKKNILFLIITGVYSYANRNVNLNKNKSSKEKYRTIVRLRNSIIETKNVKGRFLNGLIYSIKVFIKLFKKENRGDLIIFTSEPPFFVFFISVIYILFKVPYIYLVYDLYPDTLVNLNILNGKNFLVRIWFRVNKFVCVNSKNIILLSDLMRDKFLLNYGKDLRKKISVIPSWADINSIKPLSKKKNKFIKKNNFQGKFVVLYSGNQGRMHDFYTILKSAKYLKKYNEILFLFIGNGPLNKEIKDFKKLYDLKNITIMPYQPFNDLPQTLTSADIAIVSTNKNATSLVAPSKLYGHLAAATPIALVSSKKSYIKKMIENNNCGKWFNNGDFKSLSRWILELKGNKLLRKKLSSSSRNYAEQISDPEFIANKYYNVIVSSITS